MSETRALADHVVHGRWADVPDDVKHEARRAVLNYVGCAPGGARDEAVGLASHPTSPVASALVEASRSVPATRL